MAFVLSASMVAAGVQAGEETERRGADLPWYSVIVVFLSHIEAGIEADRPIGDLIAWPAEDLGLVGINQDVDAAYAKRNMEALDAGSQEAIEREAFEAILWRDGEECRRFAEAHQHLAGHGYPLAFADLLRHAETIVRPTTVVSGAWMPGEREARDRACEEGIRTVYPEFAMPQPLEGTR